MATWVDRLYYRIFPQVLLSEAVTFLVLSPGEQLQYAAAIPSLPDRWGVLMSVLQKRMKISAAEAEASMPLWEAMEHLGLDKGWCSLVEFPYAE